MYKAIIKLLFKAKLVNQNAVNEVCIYNSDYPVFSVSQSQDSCRCSFSPFFPALFPLRFLYHLNSRIV